MTQTTTALILAAGVGARLRPLTNEIPKALVKVGQQSILQRAIRILRAHGIQRFVLATGYRRTAIEELVDSLGIDAQLVDNPRFDSTQNSVSLARCADAVSGQSFLKLDGDLLFDAELLRRVDRGSAGLQVAVDRSATLDAEAMKVEIDDDRRITRFGKGLPLNRAHAESIGVERVSADAAVHLFDALQRHLREERVDLYYEDVYDELISAGLLQARAIDVGDLDWMEIDTLLDLERARSRFGDRSPPQSAAGR